MHKAKQFAPAWKATSPWFTQTAAAKVKPFIFRAIHVQMYASVLDIKNVLYINCLRLRSEIYSQEDCNKTSLKSFCVGMRQRNNGE